MIVRALATASLLAVLGLAFWNFYSPALPTQWTEPQLRLIQSLSLSQLPPLPPDPSNRVADSELAAEFGRALYFDTRLSGTGTVSCASCHQPGLMFSDGLALAVGVASGTRHTPSLVGLSYSPWFYWDGRKDSQWAQALAPLESRHEHASDRLQLSRLIAADSNYRQYYTQLFGTLPEIPLTPESATPASTAALLAAWQTLAASDQVQVSTVFANIGKALAAYQRKLMPGPGRFDDYADASIADAAIHKEQFLSSAETAGLYLFIGKAQCISCHNGPLFTNHEFHNTGVLAVNGQLPAMGRYDGVRIARQDPFNCLGVFSDADAADCLELRFARDENDLVGAHKTPTLRNIAATAPYMHGGQLATLSEVLEHYSEAPTSMLSHNEAKPLGLRPAELRQLQAFLLSLSAPLATPSKWLQAPQR
jgi:cytochrome c peroxidase